MADVEHRSKESEPQSTPSGFIAKNLPCGTVTVRAQSKARTLAEVARRINPNRRQDRYEFQLVEFLETVQRTESVDA